MRTKDEENERRQRQQLLNAAWKSGYPLGAGWRRDLMTDARALLDCGFVMKGGKVYRTESCL